MEQSEHKRSWLLPFVYRSLKICLITLGIIIAAGSIYGIFFRAAPSGGATDTQTNIQHGGHEGQRQTFTGLGRLRISTADPQPGTVILFVSFPYYPHDRAFSEELALRIRDLREIIMNYIGSFTAAELQRQDEEVIRAELLRRVNAILRLGQIETLFFSDFMII